LCREGMQYGGTIGAITVRASALSSFLERSGFIPLPPKFGGADLSLLGFWRPDHPLARYFGLPACWKVFPGFSDV